MRKILKVFGDKEVQIDPALKTATSIINDTPSPLAGEGGGEGYNFEDLHRELLFSLRYIQEMLGHQHSKTTEIYTHVSTKSLGKIRSPLDNLNLEGFHLYGINHADTDYIMDTFPIVMRKDEEKYGEYRTKRVILECYDTMQRAMETGEPYKTILASPPADPRVAHPPREELGRNGVSGW